jgi:hypothetical protein
MLYSKRIVYSKQWRVLVLLCGAALPLAATAKEVDYPPGWEQSSAATVPGLFAHATVTFQSALPDRLVAKLAAARSDCQARGRELQVQGDEGALQERSEYWLYRSEKRLVVYLLSTRLDVDVRACLASIAEIRDVDVCDIKPGSECGAENAWLPPFNVAPAESFDRYGQKKVKTIAGINARCLTNDGRNAESLCFSIKADRSHAMLLAQTTAVERATRVRTFAVDKVVRNGDIDANILDKHSTWYRRK